MAMIITRMMVKKMMMLFTLIHLSAFAHPVKRKQKKRLDLSQWRELVPSDNSLEIDEVEKNRVGLKNTGKFRKDGEAADGVEKRKLLNDPLRASEVPMEVDTEAELSSSMPPAEVKESITSAADMEIENRALSEMLKKREQLNETVVSSSGFNSYGNEKGFKPLEGEIDAENRSRLQSMSAEEIAEAQAEIMEKMNPELLNLLKKRGQEKMKKKNVSRSDEAVSSQVDGIPIENRLLKHSEISPHAGSERSEMMTMNISKDSNSGLDNNVLHDFSTTSGCLWNTWSERVEAVRGLRFSLEGTVIADEPETGNITSGDGHSADNVAERDFLRTEGDPGAAGYTIKEAVQLTRSVIPGQRALALHLLASVLDNAIHGIQQNKVGSSVSNANHVDKSDDWEAIWAFALGPEPELVLALRMCLDDNHYSVVLACVKVIQSALSCDLNETFYEISEKTATCEEDIFTAPVFRSKPDIDAGFLHGGFWKYNAKPSNILAFSEDIVDDEIEGKHTIQDDIAVASQDFAAGLVRMGILLKMRYLLEADPAAPLEECIISILLGIARHSITCANAIMKFQRLVNTVVHRFTMGDNIEVRPSKIKSVRLLKVLAQSDKSNCIELIKNGFVQAMTWHLYRYTSSLDYWLKSGKEICKLSSGLMVEELRLWKVCINYGCCISCFSDIFPALCLWLNPPTFTKLQENNVLGEFASVSKEAYLVLEALSRNLPNFYMQKHANNKMSDFAGDEQESWSWSFVTPMIDLALKWIESMSDPYISKIFELEKGNRSEFVFQDSSVSSLLWVYSAVLHMLSTLLERVIPEDALRLQGSSQHVPWLPEFVPKIGLGVVKNGFLSFIDELCHLRQHSKSETSLASSIETFGRGGPTPGVGIGWGASGGGFWSMTVLLAQTDARLLTSMLEIFQLSTTEVPTNEEMVFTMNMISSLLGVCLIIGPRDIPVMKKAGNCKATPEDNFKGKSSLETIHEDMDISDMTRQDNHSTSLTAEWAHQRLPLPLHWFLSPIATITNNKQGCFQSASDTRNLIEDTHDTIEMPPSPVRCTPLIWKLHSLSVILLTGMGVLEDDKSRDVYEALQNLYGQLLDESRSIRSAECFSEDNVNVLPENGKKSTVEFLRFQSEIHESYSTVLEILVEQFASISYGDIIFGRQVAVYLHRCTETPVRLAAWNGLANAHVLEILPPLEKCFAEAEGYLEPVEDNEGILEAYVKAWVSGALDRAATRVSMAFTLALHHLSSFIFLFHANDKITLRNKLAKSLLRDYSKKTRHEGIMLELVRYYKPSSRLPEKQEGLSLQASDIEKRFEVLVEACDRDSSLLIEVEKLKSAFVKKQSVDRL
ncbi:TRANSCRIPTIONAL ELONGATION REGULATOR MINIYO [Salix purpurea]|uniref:TRANSCRIPTIONAL ELONGATION REGULATOR MINIYO n=1 Tax=Salix purpurea TaxID=77065 RepID=A0A9Q0PRE4_SALPP|nr:TRANSCRIPTIONAL ELONGATION REGULATOR MINIYO [Salix purpurea]